MPDVVELLPADGRAVLHPRFVRPGPYDALFRDIDWKQENVRVFGRTHPVPRLVAFYGEHPYRYSGLEHPARAMPEILDRLRTAAEAAAGFAFNSVLCNCYRDGRDSMGWHRDNEPAIDPACIASLSFGAARRFKLRHRGDRRTVDVDLEDGALLLMIDCQEHWEHALPKTARPVGARINLTFRRIDPVHGARARPGNTLSQQADSDLSHVVRSLIADDWRRHADAAARPRVVRAASLHFCSDRCCALPCIVSGIRSAHTRGKCDMNRVLSLAVSTALLAAVAAHADSGSRPQSVAVTHVTNGGLTAATILTTSMGSPNIAQSNYTTVISPPFWVNGHLAVGAPSWGIAFPDPDQAVATHPDTTFLSILERTSPSSGTFSKTDEIEVPAYCTEIVADPGNPNFVYVANRGASDGGAPWQHSVLRINLNNGNVSKTIPVEREPSCLAFSPDGDRLFVGHIGGALGKAGIASNVSFDVSPAGLFDGGSIVVFQAGGSYPAVARIAVGSPVRDVTVLQPTSGGTPTDHYVVLFTHVGDGAQGESPAHGGRSIANVISSVRVDASSHAVLNSRRDVVLAHDPDAEFTYDPSDHTDQPAVLPARMAVRWDDSAGSGELWITNAGSGTVSRVSLDGNGEIVTDGCIDVTDTGADPIPVVTGRGTGERPVKGTPVSGSGSTCNFSFGSQPLATWLFHLADDPYHVVVDAVGPAAWEEFASRPRGIAYDPVFDFLYVATSFDNELIQIDPDSTGSPIAGRGTLCWSGCTAVDEPERNFFTFGRGFDFREGGAGGAAKVNTIACATCHPGGHLDGKVRLTPAGGGTPVAVPSVFDVGASEWIFFTGGTTILDADPGGTCTYCQDVQFFLDTVDFTSRVLSPRSPHALDEVLDADEQSGRALFQAMNCVRCHAGEVPSFQGLDRFVRTNAPLPATIDDTGPLASGPTGSVAKNLLHDPTQVFITDTVTLDNLSQRNSTNVGTGDPANVNLAVNTPALAGAWDNAPYLHDGRYRTLEEVLDHTWLDPTDGYRAAPAWAPGGAPDNAFDQFVVVTNDTVPSIKVGTRHAKFRTHSHAGPTTPAVPEDWVPVSSHLTSNDLQDLLAFLRALSSQTDVPSFFNGTQPALRQEAAELDRDGARLLSRGGHGAPDPEISFRLAHAAETDLRIYDVAGRVIRTHRLGVLAPGLGSWRWDGNDQQGDRVASGVYFVRLTAGRSRDTAKLVVVR